MNRQILLPLLAAVIECGFCAEHTAAHPASGIVVDAQGQVFFVLTGKGLMKIEPDGKLTCIHPSRGGHWLCLDPSGSFSRAQPKYFERVTPDGVKPAIIFADGGAPIAICRDGNLYYGSGVNNGREASPGGLTVTRMTPDRRFSQFAPDLPNRLAGFEDGVTGLAAAPDGSLYVASPSSVIKVGMDGAVTTICHPVKISDCDEDPPDHNTSNHKPAIRGLAVDSNGIVYAAATSCHRVLRITPDGHVGILVKSERPWSPTAVALHNGAVYVLEYTNANGGPTEDGGWRPRVRKIEFDGKVTMLAEVSADDANRR